MNEQVVIREPTGRLRWCVLPAMPEMGVPELRDLQQEWKNVATGETWWEDVQEVTG